MFSLNETTLLSAIKSRSLFSALNSALLPSWGITYSKVADGVLAVPGQTVFSPSGWISAEPMGDATVVSSPIEEGSYTSFNKVRRPSDLRVVFSLEGWTAYSGSLANLTNFTTQSRGGLLDKLEQMKNTACTYDIETPDKLYQGYDLIHYDYAINATKGVTLLTVSATFQEIMDIGEVTISSANTNNSPSSNLLSVRDSAIKTVKGQAQSKEVTMDDVQTAWKSGSTSLSDALSTTGSGIVSGVNSAATSVAKSWDKSTTGISQQIKNGVSKFIQVVM